MSSSEQYGPAACDTSILPVVKCPASHAMRLPTNTGPSSHAAVARALEDRTGTPPSRGTVRAVHLATGGNTLFLSALLASLRTTDALAAWRDASHVPVPTAAQTAILRSLYGLRQAERAVVMFAACLGRSFELAKLEYVTGVDRGQLRAVLDSVPVLLQKAPASADRYVFTSGFAQTVIAASLPPMTTRQLKQHFDKARKRAPRRATQLLDAFRPAPPEEDTQVRPLTSRGGC